MNDTKTRGAPSSGRFLLRISPGLHDALRRGAAEAGLSLNEYCARKLAAPGQGLQGRGADVVERAASLFGEKLVGVLVFGSWARGETADESDVDILVVVDPEVAIVRSLYRVWDEATGPLTWDGRRLEVHLVGLPGLGQAPSGLWAEAALDGIVLFDRGFELSRRLIDLRRLIAAGAVRREGVHGQDHVRRAEIRLRTLDVLFDAESWADVVRESQEVVELALKGLLRAHGIAPPRVHDVSDVLEAERRRLPDALDPEIPALIRASRQLRRDRELAFYGAEDLTPSGFYERSDAEQARATAQATVATVKPHVLGGDDHLRR